MNRYLTLGLAGALLVTANSLADERMAAGGARDFGSYNNSRSATNSDYAVKWNRRAKVGQKMHVRGDGIQEHTITTVRGGATPTTEASNISVSFDAEAHVLSVDTKSTPTRVAYTIKTCTMTQDGQQVTVAPSGSVITAVRQKNGTAFQMNGRPLRAESTQALEIVASLEADGDLDDRILGSSQPRSIGESWSINVNEAVRAFQTQSSGSISEDDVFGVTTLVDVLDHRGEPCLLVHAQVSTENVVPGFDSLPGDMKVQRANMTSTYQGYLPVNPSLPVLSDSTRMDMSAVLTSSSGRQPVEMRINSLRIVDLESTLLPSSTASAGEFDSTSE